MAIEIFRQKTFIQKFPALVGSRSCSAKQYNQEPNGIQISTALRDTVKIIGPR